MTARWLDQFLGERSPLDPSRDDVLKALRGHILGPLIVEHERPDGSTEMHVQGALVEASRDPADWENAEIFAVVAEAAALGWHLVDKHWDNVPDARRVREAAEQPPLFVFGVPQTGIIEYVGADAGSSGYRWPLDDGTDLAVVIWHDVLHVTASGDLAPGMGGFTAEIRPVEGDVDS